MTGDPSHSAEFLRLLNESLSFAPARGDLWMKRFEVMRSLGLKREFAEAVKQAFDHPELKRQLRWSTLQDLWDELAAGEDFPAPVSDPPRSAFRPTETGRFKRARFSDVAARLAATELGALARTYGELVLQPDFFKEFARKTAPLLMRPTALEYSEALSAAAGHRATVYVKREDQRGIAAEKEHAAAQCYIASLLGKSRVVTGNDVDEHALAVAEMAPFFRLKCTIVLRPEDVRTKRDLLAKLHIYGAQVETVPETGMVSTDPREAALRLWQKAHEESHLVLSLGMAPPPYVAMANNFQAMLGRETEGQYRGMASMFDRPLTLVAAVGSEADSIGFVLPFLNRKDVKVVYAEPEPGGMASWRVPHRLRHYHGQVREHSWLLGAGRIRHVTVPDQQAADWRNRLMRHRMFTSLEDARAVAITPSLIEADASTRDYIVLLGRG